jgi:tRNA1(Val) A37 N6-methylase TrmN6
MVTLVSTYSLKEASDARRDSINAICVVDTKQNRTLRRMIVDGTKNGRVFEELYERYGAPPYRERLDRAYTQAARLPDVDCEALHEGRPPE